jgi:hypothetical protein
LMATSIILIFTAKVIVCTESWLIIIGLTFNDGIKVVMWKYMFLQHLMQCFRNCEGPDSLLA